MNYTRILVFSFVALLIAGGGWYVWRGHRDVYAIASSASSLLSHALTKPHDEDAEHHVSKKKKAAFITPPAVTFSAPTQPVDTYPLVAGGKLTIGSSLSRVGATTLVEQPLSDGLFLAFNHLNTQEGGIHGAQISLDMRDDGEQPATAFMQLDELLNKTHLFFSPAGDPILEKVYHPLLTTGLLALLFPATGMRTLFGPQLPVLFWRPSFSHEISALIHYARHVLKKHKFALFYEESTWALEAREAARKILNSGKEKQLVAEVAYQPETVTVSSAVASLKRSEPHVVLCFAEGRPAYNFIREAINQQLHYASFLGLSNLAAIVAHLKKSRGITMVTSSVVPNPFSSALSIVQQYRDAMQRYLPNKGLSLSSLEGYITASLFASLVAGMPKEATIGDLFAHIRAIKNKEFGGLTLSYKDRCLSQSVWINEGFDRQWVEYRVGEV
jgi:branched-chain amino acid transport system substrate-binding protein